MSGKTVARDAHSPRNRPITLKPVALSQRPAPARILKAGQSYLFAAAQPDPQRPRACVAQFLGRESAVSEIPEDRQSADTRPSLVWHATLTSRGRPNVDRKKEPQKILAAI